MAPSASSVRLRAALWASAAAIAGENGDKKPAATAAHTLDNLYKTRITSNISSGNTDLSNETLKLLKDLRLLTFASEFANRPECCFVSHTILESMVAEQPFQELPAPTQAMLQAVMKQLVRRAKARGLDPRLLQLLPRVPLMHAADYADIMAMMLDAGYREEYASTWRAAVAAATDPALTSLPAFGGRRPDEAWLAQQLQQMTAAAEAGGASCFSSSSSSSSSRSATDTCTPAGVLLLHSVCATLQAAYSTNKPPVQQLQPVTASLVGLLLQHPDADRPPALQALLCAAAGAAAAQGEISLWETATQHAAQLRLSRADAAAVTCHLPC
ncbi:hypothetical protein COO60DRAFT_1653987 [Scenedesmus sp. NREL 46B-D3]|nr:hypothetical protein COO60DRAFT_1653987 [Scenedesmus sp. NREL 46B-D3]